MYILGVNISHDSSTCLLKDGEIVYYSENERLTGDKAREEDDKINIIKTFFNENKILPIYDHIESIKKYTKEIDYIIFSSYGSYRLDNEDKFIDDKILIRSIISKLSEENIKFNTSVFYENNHHIYHAANAFYASGFQDSAALIMDGGGSFDHDYFTNHTKKISDYPFREVESIYTCSYDFPNFTSHYKVNSMLDDPFDETEEIFWKKTDNEIYTKSRSCGDIFNVIAQMLDMGKDNSNGAGKLMGLSGHRLKTDKSIPMKLFDRSKIDQIIDQYETKHEMFLVEWFEKIDDVYVTRNRLLSHINDFMKNNVRDKSLSKQNLDFYILASLAYKLQKETFLHTIRLIDKAIKITGKNRIVLSGGYFMNCVNNFKYTQLFPQIEFFVDPIPHDGGTAIGAAKYFWYGLTKSKDKFQFENVYFGP